MRLRSALLAACALPLLMASPVLAYDPHGGNDPNGGRGPASASVGSSHGASASVGKGSVGVSMRGIDEVTTGVAPTMPSGPPGTVPNVPDTAVDTRGLGHVTPRGGRHGFGGRRTGDPAEVGGVGHDGTSGNSNSPDGPGGGNGK